MTHRAGQFFFGIKNIKKKLKSKSIRFSTKIYPRVLGLATTSDLRIIFIILIIILNLHDPSLSGFAISNLIALDGGLAARLYHKSVIIK